MPEKKDVFKQQVKQKGFFNYDEVYKFCFNWLKEEGYNISEDKYDEKIRTYLHHNRPFPNKHNNYETKNASPSELKIYYYF